MDVAAPPLMGHAARRRHSGPRRLDLGRPVRAEGDAAARRGSHQQRSAGDARVRIKADAERYKRVVQKAGVKPG
jgi:hypothetical protein